MEYDVLVIGAGAAGLMTARPRQGLIDAGKRGGRFGAARISAGLFTGS